MKTGVDVKIYSPSREDVEEIKVYIQKALFKDYIVVPGRLHERADGVHVFIRVKPMPKSVLSGLGDSGREE